MTVGIVVILPTLGGGGTERQLAFLSQHLASTTTVTVVTLIPSSVVPDIYALMPTVRRMELDFTRPLGVTKDGWALLRSLRRDRPKTMIGLTTPGVAVARLSGLLTNVPVISSFRTSNPPRRWVQALLRVTRRIDTATVFNSAQAANEYASRKLAGREVKVVPNATREPAASELWRGELRSGPDDPFRWLAVGRMIEAKGFDVLLEALQILMADRSHRRIRLDIMGDGPDFRNRERISEQQGLTAAVSLRAFDPTWQRRLNSYDAFVLSSRWEGSPNVVTEVAIRGMPSVVTNVGDAADQSPAFVAEPSSATSLATAMSRMMECDLEERRSIGNDARMRAIRLHSMDVVMSGWTQTLGLVDD